jgi:hypothetical protein
VPHEDALANGSQDRDADRDRRVAPLVGAGIGLVAMGVLCGGDSGGCAEASPVVTFAALVGTGVGALIKSDRWQTVPLDRVRVTLTPARRGVGLAVSIGF